jgi:transposase
MSGEPPIPAELWAKVPADAQAALLALFALHQQRIEQLQRRIADLEERLNQDSTNSSKPPSSDGPAVKRAPPRPPSGRRAGGQPGHPRHTRPLLEPTHTVVVKPAICSSCGTPLLGDDPSPRRHQVLELPEVKPAITEYQLHRLTCPCCHADTAARLPQDACPAGQGPRLQALVGLLTGVYRLSKAQVEQLLGDLFAIPLSTGQVCATEHGLSQALAPVVGELGEHVRGQDANVDETGWKQGGQRRWLWVAVTRLVTLFRVTLGRGYEDFKALLGADYGGVLTSDRYGAYDGVRTVRQLCWAHLIRDFQAMVDRDDAGRAIGEQLLEHSRLLFAMWHEVRAPGEDRRDFVAVVREWLRPNARRVLEEGTRCGAAKTARVCAKILEKEEWLWTFVFERAVEPTNNAAERALRHAVLWRKCSHGTQSEVGSAWVGRILSVVATCRQQGKNVWHYLTACAKAAARGEPAPSLLPQT